jgi:hypothetical protein
MTDAPPIDFPAALENAKFVTLLLRRAGPDVFDITRPKYAGMIHAQDATITLIEMVIEHKRAREAGGVRP